MFKKLSISARWHWLSHPARLRRVVATTSEELDFSFEGPFGTFDQNQLQRGLQVYTEVCSACHGLKYVPTAHAL